MAKKFNVVQRKKISEDLVKACLELWSSKGYSKTSIDELVAKVGISKGSFYNFYESKEELFFVSLFHVYRGIEDNVYRHIKKNKDQGKDGFKKAILEFFDEILKYSWIFALETSELDEIFKNVSSSRKHSRNETNRYNVRFIINAFDLVLVRDIEDITSAVLLLWHSVIIKDELGDKYEDSVNLLLDGIIETSFE